MCLMVNDGENARSCDKKERRRRRREGEKKHELPQRAELKNDPGSGESPVEWLDRKLSREPSACVRCVTYVGTLKLNHGRTRALARSLARSYLEGGVKRRAGRGRQRHVGVSAHAGVCTKGTLLATGSRPLNDS